MRALALTLLAACSTPYTWGDVSTELAQAYCDAQVWCGNEPARREDLCVEDLVWWWCDADETCDLEVDEDAFRAALDPCLAALDHPKGSMCEYLIAGIPSACWPVLDMEPH